MTVLKSKTATLAFSSINIGDKLPDMGIDINVSFVVAGAVASRDFTPVHHNKAAANASGLANVFPNILTDNGLVGRFVTDWAGPDATLKRVNIKLGAPVQPGEVLKFTGEVASKDDANNIVDVKVTAKGNWGMHLDGIARVQLPK
ncbi:MAG: acyl dehydratase [Pseudomonadales bacterium]|jgi:acyl dehydratase|nr:acyl dehydratase [Cellvibrionales bacterium]MBP8030458.1 acyl dehydratase [Pseudomonadales bacterium]